MNSARTLSSFFDIKWRLYTFRADLDTSYRKRYPVSEYRPSVTIPLNDSIQLVEGLIVDIRQGGVGLRNHSVPIELSAGGV